MSELILADGFSVGIFDDDKLVHVSLACDDVIWFLKDYEGHNERLKEYFEFESLLGKDWYEKAEPVVQGERLYGFISN